MMIMIKRVSYFKLFLVLCCQISLKSSQKILIIMTAVKIMLIITIIMMMIIIIMKRIIFQAHSPALLPTFSYKSLHCVHHLYESIMSISFIIIMLFYHLSKNISFVISSSYDIFMSYPILSAHIIISSSSYYITRGFGKPLGPTI